jgi:hypothetical protein
MRLKAFLTVCLTGSGVEILSSSESGKVGIDAQERAYLLAEKRAEFDNFLRNSLCPG